MPFIAETNLSWEDTVRDFPSSKKDFGDIIAA